MDFSGETDLDYSEVLVDKILNHTIIIASNRGPVTFYFDEDGEYHFEKGSGGLVTALTGMMQQLNATWIACSRTQADLTWHEGSVPLSDGGNPVHLVFLSPDPEVYERYYNVIANPLLWFVQHALWDQVYAPTIDQSTWDAWEGGYKVVNRLFADEIVRCVRQGGSQPVVMLQDYHLYLVARYIRDQMRPRERPLLMHFTHIPWPGPDYWGILPPVMRQTILDGLCAVDLAGFQTREDRLNFIRTCESFLPQAHVNFKRGWVWHRNHITHVRDFPISIDNKAVKELASSPAVTHYEKEITELVGDKQLILRVDRIEPTKNIVRGIQAYEQMLDQHPEHRGKVIFLALLVPSRLEVDQYQNYLDHIMAATGRVNTRFGDSDWEPVRLLIGEDYPRAIAALKHYDVLLVNSIPDGMNLVAQEGPLVNERNGALILSERAGISQQLSVGAIVLSPFDVYATGEALHQALTMPADERSDRATRLRWVIEREDVSDWLYKQIRVAAELNLLSR